MGDWLGTGSVALGADWRSFKKARAFVRRLGLKSKTEWREYYKSGKKPADIPASPNIIYAEAGWARLGRLVRDWQARHTLRQYRSFKKARAYVHRLGLKSRTEWREYCKSGKKPADIPANPNRTYAEDGWAGYGDWLGTG